MSNKYEATFHPSDGPTDQGAREALVEQLAEAIRSVVIPDSAEQLRDLTDALEPVVAAQVEAAVSLVRAERDEANSRTLRMWERAKAAESERDPLREKIARVEALRDVWLATDGAESAFYAQQAGTVLARALSDPATPDRALLAPSPAEGTGEVALCPTCQHQRWKHDANGCAHREPGESICGCVAPTPVSSGEAGGCGPFCAHQTRGDKDCEDARPAPVVTPSAEDGA